MSTWSSLLIKQKTYEITKLLPETEYTVSINGIYNEPIEVWLTTLITDENGIVETEVNQDNAVYVGDLEHNKLTFTAQESHTALVIRTQGDLELTTIQLEKGNLATDWTPTPEDFNTLKGIRYSLSQPLQKDQYYTLGLESEVDDSVGAWLGKDVYLGYLKDNKLTFKLTEQFNHDHIILKSLSESGIISKIKLEKGKNPNPTWTPAWEDLPLKDKLASFIEVSGGMDIMKYYLNVVTPSVSGTKYQFGGKFKNIGDSNLVINSNLNFSSEVDAYETIELNDIVMGDGASTLTYQFRTKNISDNLSFYAYNPSVVEVSESGYNEKVEKGEYYEIQNVLDNNATLSFDIINNQPSISYDSIIGENGTTNVNIKLPDQTLMSLPFNWNTNRVNSQLSSYIEAIPSKTEFVIEDANLADINNWSQDVALSLASSLEKNESIKVYFHVKDTNIENIFISNDLGADFSLAASGLQYTNGTGSKAPITVVNSKNNSFYSGDMVPGNYYLVVSKGYLTTPSIRLFSGKNELEQFEMPDNYSFGESKAMIIKAAAGVDNFIYTDDSSFTPYLFKFTPIEESIDILGQDKYYDGSLLNIDRLAADVPNYLDLIPKSREDNPSPDFSFEVDENGIGYMLINPLFAINPTYFSSTFANSNTNIRVDTTTGESTTFSIFRKVFPYRELSDLAGDMKIIQNNTYIDAGSINTLKTVADRISIERDRIVELIEEEAVESAEPERVPGRVTSNMLYPPQHDEGESSLYYTIPTEGQTINFNEPRVEGNMVDYRSFVGLNLYDESYYYVSFEVDSVNSVTLSFRMMNVLNDSTVGDSSPVTFTGKRKFEFLIPRIAAPQNGDETTVVSNYLLNYLTNTSNVPAPFNRPLVDHTAENQFSPYYLYMIVDDSKPKPEEVRISNLIARELRYEKKTTSNIYFSLVGSTSYVEMNTYINSFLNDVRSLVQLYNTQIEDNGKSNILTEDYLYIWDNYSLATEWLEKVLKEMDTTLRREMQEGVFRTSTTSREHIFGFTNSEEYLSSFSITPGGVLIRGEKNEIIGSTSIGELYGKKIVIGKSITQKDIEFDMEYRKTSGQGFLAVWESDLNSQGQELESGVWSSVLNKQGQFFMRYRPNSSTGKKEMVGYMVMNAEEIAAYNFNSVISEGLSDPAPMDFLEVPKTSIFEINSRGQVSINQLVVNDSGNLKGNLDLMNVIRITRFTSSDGERDGIVFIGI